MCLDLMRYNEYYEYQIAILSYNGEWAMVDVGTLLNEDDLEHDWCWMMLESIGLFKTYFIKE